MLTRGYHDQAHAGARNAFDDPMRCASTSLLLQSGRWTNLAPMTAPQVWLLGCGLAIFAACATSGPFVPDSRARDKPSARQTVSADDVFKRAPWEIWRMPTGTARYHRGTGMLLPDQLESFQVSEVSVYQADGSDVRVDYYSVDLGGGTQAHESISVYVYRAQDRLDAEWKAVAERANRKWPGASPAQPFPVPAHHPNDTKQLALIAGARGADLNSATFVQTTLFHIGPWAVRYDITCPAADVDATREKTRTFLRSLRAQEYAGRTD